MSIRRLVLDCLKPHEPDVIVLAEKLSELEGVTAVNINVVEIDRKVENVKVTIVGDAIPFDAGRKIIRELGGVVHSIDEVVAGAKIIEATTTLQDH
jgi:hypothetical protein